MPPPPVPSKGKRKPKTSPRTSNKRRKTKGKGKAPPEDNEEEPSSSEQEEGGDLAGISTPRRSERARKIVAGGYGQDEEYEDPEDPNSDIEMNDGTPPSLEPMQLDLEIEEEKPKPVLQLRYQGFRLEQRCLCIVVEPWPAIRAASRAPSMMPSASRQPSLAPNAELAEHHEPLRSRAQTPLFLPDYDDDRERSVTPAPARGQRILPPVPLFDDDSEEEDNGGMIEFSQVLNSGDLRAGALDDDDDMEGAVFFGDADEVREL